MKSNIIRQQFLSFFNSKGHVIVPSAPIVVKDDPTLMFTNAGMNQFKDYFLGNRQPTERRVADTQKCLRVSGKHNDLEEVGLDTYHHTMFEMLGNWSFGDYFKNEAISWAWELLTEVYKLPKERLYVTVFGGDTIEEMEADDAAAEIWGELIDKDNILYAGRKDNFWEMGDTGPCGPCSEIHIDLRTEDEIKEKSGRELVNEGHPLVVEIWNLVFIQFNRLANGELENLPQKHVDTGMGFERLCMAIQGKRSNYDTDVFTPLIEKISAVTGKKYGENKETDIAMRVIADHVRAVAFTIADGQLPSNNKAGYVIRRILRRAVRYSYTFLDHRGPLLSQLVPVLAEEFADVFPELGQQKSFVQKVVKEEESSFLRTLENGLKRLDQVSGNLISGKVAFELYDTFGFPFDLTALIAREKGLEVDEKGFQEEMLAQRTRSKSAAKTEKGDWVSVNEIDRNEFVGYDLLETQAQVVKYRQIKTAKKDVNELVLSRTPFYAESGGQIGDTGILLSGEERINVINTVRENDLIIHVLDRLPSNPELPISARVNVNRRKSIMNNHSATHLLHSALRQVLGDHVAQRGSLVTDNVLRFDFSHFSKMTEVEIEQVERLVNEKIRENIALLEKRDVPIDEARAMGATALFGEKYGDEVRVIAFDSQYSVELCGGTHVPATGHIGSFKIIAESAIAAGVRRIEAVTAQGAEQYQREQEKLLRNLKDMLKQPSDLLKAVGSIQEEANLMRHDIEEFVLDEMARVKEMLLDNIGKRDQLNFIIKKIKISSADAVKKLAFELRNEIPHLFLVLAADVKGKPNITVMIADDLIKECKLDAGKMVRELAKLIKGGGGGQPFFAQAGGKDVDGLDAVVRRAGEMVADQIIEQRKNAQESE